MDRRRFIYHTALAAGATTLPATLFAQTAPTIFRWVPANDLSILDPSYTTAAITATHALMVFDTLYGLDAQYQPQPQMIESEHVDQNGLRWTLQLREGLMFHDGSPVRAQDAVASIKRFGARNLIGQTLFSCLDTLSATSDRSLEFKLTRPFSLLSVTLASAAASIMPERLANTPDNIAIKEIIGSGPFRFLPHRWVSGSQIVYQKSAQYRPRLSGQASNTAGPKIAHIDEVRWQIIPDRATAVAALQNNEVDGIEVIDNEFIPTLRKNKQIALIKAPLPSIFILRFNHLHAPFDNPAMRRAILSVINQTDYMMAANGADFPEYWNDKCGVFAPGTPMASTAGMDKLTGKRNLAQARKLIKDSGYAGQPIIILDPVDTAPYHACALVTEDLFKQLGIKTELRAMNWGSYLQRRNNQSSPAEGGWHIGFTALVGTGNLDPVSNPAIRGTGKLGWFGWPTNDTLEKLRQDWLFAATLQERQAICRDIQVQVMEHVPYIPLGAVYNLTALRKNWNDFQPQGPAFFTLRRT